MTISKLVSEAFWPLLLSLNTTQNRSANENINSDHPSTAGGGGTGNWQKSARLRECSSTSITINSKYRTPSNIFREDLTSGVINGSILIRYSLYEIHVFYLLMEASPLICCQGWISRLGDSYLHRDGITEVGGQCGYSTMRIKHSLWVMQPCIKWYLQKCNSLTTLKSSGMSLLKRVTKHP